MALATLDLSVMERVEREQANRRLARYLCETLAAVLPRLPSAAQYVPRFVALAGANATSAGFDQGRQYSSHIMLSFLLGLHWQRDPAHRLVALILEDPGMAQDLRLDLALNTAIKQRRELESVLPMMHDISLVILGTPFEKLTPDAMWLGFQRLVEQRGVVDAQEVLQLFTRYEADALEHLKLAPIKRKQLTAYERWLHKELDIPIPAPTEDLQDMEHSSLIHLTHHVLLAASFGRFYALNPLLAPLHHALSDESSLSMQNRALATFLQQHQHALTEPAHG